MSPHAILFGAVGTLTETSELQRQAFNAAFAEAGLSWVWERDAYIEMLHTPGGQRRIELFAASRGQSVDAGALHSAKVDHFRRLAEVVGLRPRPGVMDLIEAAQASGVQLGLVSTTGPDTVALVLNGLADWVSAGDFSYLGDRTLVARPKPAPDIYLHALEVLQVAPEEALAIEDTPESAMAAVAAGIPTIAFPGDAAAGRVFPEGCRKVSELSADLVTESMETARAP